MKVPIREYAGKLSESRAFLFMISVLIGVVLFHVLIGVPKVGVITLNTVIMTETTKNDIIDLVQYAGDDNSIKAVALIMDSPGGEVTKIEEIYLEVLKLKAKKPVVVSVESNALSGGYYIAAAANFIYVKPSSNIGNVGVISTLPEPWKPDNVEITTGPFKASGFSRKTFVPRVEAIKQAFLMAVLSQRGDKLKLSPERLSSAEIFLGTEGVKYGLADALGTGSDALQRAASLGGVAHYETLNINEALNITFSGRFHGLAGVNETLTPAHYYIYQELEEP